MLLVEDRTQVRELLQGSLERAGYRVRSAATPERAIELWTRERGAYDLIVTDVAMPGMRGSAMIKQLELSGSTCPVLFISGYSAEQPFGEIESPWVFLKKPFTPNELLRQVRDLLDRT